MKKIMFNTPYNLTRAVIDGSKTQTRREIYPQPIGDFAGIMNYTKQGKKHKGIIYQRADFSCGISVDIPLYVGEIVAVAQSYKNAGYGSLEVLDMALDDNVELQDVTFAEVAGWNNKMFVKAELMPHQIKITNVRAERLQDISDEDCLKEGIEVECEEVSADGFAHREQISYCYYYNGDEYIFDDPRSAFASLIDRVSGKGTWERNPFVFAYEFELIK